MTFKFGKETIFRNEVVKHLLERNFTTIIILGAEVNYFIAKFYDVVKVYTFKPEIQGLSIKSIIVDDVGNFPVNIEITHNA